MGDPGPSIALRANAACLRELTARTFMANEPMQDEDDNLALAIRDTRHWIDDCRVSYH
jgi:hypothetical protein